MDYLEPIQKQYNLYPEIIQYSDQNTVIKSPNSSFDLYFYQTKETLMDVDVYRTFLKNCESRFRASAEYKMYKHYLIEYLGIDRCQVFGNITTDDAEIELHHNVLGLFDICLLISSHVVNTIGVISTFDLVQLLIQEHYANNVGVTFLSKTAHQKFTNDYDSYIPPDMTFGSWWNLLAKYKYGITYDIANKVVRYINKYNKEIPSSINIMQNDELFSYAYYNEYGIDPNKVGVLPYRQEFLERYGEEGL